MDIVCMYLSYELLGTVEAMSSCVVLFTQVHWFKMDPFLGDDMTKVLNLEHFLIFI